MWTFRTVGGPLALVLASILPAKAQVTVDVSKITCEQWLAYKVADPERIAAWLSGYYHSKRNDTIVEVQVFKENINQLKDLCIRNLNTPVMLVIEKQLDKGK